MSVIKTIAQGFTGFSLAQLIAFIGAAYPATSTGITIIFAAFILIIVGFGFLEWSKFKQRNPQAPFTIAPFAGSIVISSLLVVCIISGVYIALGV